MLIICLCIMLLGSFATNSVHASEPVEKVYFSVRDRRGDDYGSGGLKYPTDPLFVPGVFDLIRFRAGTLPDKVWFDLTFREVTNPFNAPEGYFHQRMEVFIDTRTGQGSSEIVIGGHTLRLAQGSTWQVRISGAPFAESRAYVWRDGRLREFVEGVGSYLLPDGRTIRIEVSQEILPPINSSWRYVVLIGGFDVLAPDYWRQGVGFSDQWRFEAELPIADLLGPWWSWPSQKQQLREGVLYPIQRRSSAVLFLGGVAVTALLLSGLLVLYRRWKHA